MTGLLRGVGSNPATLAQNGAYQFSARHALVHYKSNAIYTFIPKNACSTMRFSLALANNCIKDESEWTWIHANNATFAASLRDLVTTPYSFVILRCPYRRLASVYLDKMISKRYEFWILQQLSNYAMSEDMLTFGDFVRYLKNNQIRRANVHWRDQVDFLVYEKYSSYFHLENFSAAKPVIEAETGIEIKDTRHLAKHGTDQYAQLSDGNFAEAPRFEIDVMQRAGDCPSHAALYSPELIDIVRDIYRNDIALFKEKFGAEHLLFP
jgi:hypothetical protein